MLAVADMVIESGHRPARDGYHQAAAWRQGGSSISQQQFRVVYVLQHFGTKRMRGSERPNLAVWHRLQQVADLKARRRNPAASLLNPFLADVESQKLDHGKSWTKIARKLTRAATKLKESVAGAVWLNLKQTADDALPVRDARIVV